MSSLFVPKGSSSTTDYVINQMKELLITGKLRPGDRLPSEYELAESLGVSRGSVRSAMKVFEVCGIADIRQGDGTYISSGLNPKRFNPLFLSLALLAPDAMELTKFREKVELDIAELIIKDPSLTQAVLPKLKENLEEGKKLRAQGAPIEELATNDTSFHMLLAAGCGNIVFETVYHYILDFFFSSISSSYLYQNLGEVAMEDHQRIYDAISQGNYSMVKDAIVDSMQYLYDVLEQ